MRKKEILKENKELLKRFEATLMHVGEKRRKDAVMHVRIFSNVLGKPLDKATHGDIVKALKKEEKRLSHGSFIQRVCAVKQFYKAIKKKRLVKDIKLPKRKKPKPKYPSAEEFNRILNAPMHPRDRSLLCTGYETATAGRAEKELLNINLGDIRIQNNTAYIQIWESKTDARQVIVKKFIADFKHWLNLHPFNQGDITYEELEKVPLYITAFNPKRVPQALRVSLTPDKKYAVVDNKRGFRRRIRLYQAPNGRMYSRMSYSSARLIMRAACKQAGTKIYSLRALRHRRAKDLEHVLPLREKMAYMGWSNVNTALIYGTFTSEEACDSIIAAEENRPLERNDEVKNWRCEGCQTNNPPTAKFCLNCSQPKDVKMAMGLSMKAVGDIVDLVLSKVLSNDEMKEMLIESLKEELQRDTEEGRPRPKPSL